MNKQLLILLGFIASFATGYYLNVLFAGDAVDDKVEHRKTIKQKTMNLGAFSVSLSVKDLQVSKGFYEKLGFSVFAGGMEQNYLIMKNGNALIGLFQGMFQGTMLTFNPGWDENAREVENFDDIRSIQQRLKSSGVKLTSEADEQSNGPASLMLSDPDGNVILLDQHR